MTTVTSQSRRSGPSRRQLLQGAGAAALAAAALPAGRAHAATGALEFWSQLAGSKKDAGEALEAAFRAAHPDIDLTSSLFADKDQLNEKILTSISGNTVPDLFVQHWDLTLNYGSGGKLVDMEQAMAGFGLDRIDPSLLAYCRFDGATVSVPLYGTARGLGFNRRLVAEAGLDPDAPPRDWDELRGWLAAITRRNGDLFEIGGISLFYDDTSAFEAYTLFLQAAGGQVLSDDASEPAFNSPEGVEAMQFLHDLVFVDKVTSAPFGMVPFAADPFTGQRAGMIIAGNFNINNSRRAGIDFGVSAMPLRDGGGFTSIVDPFCFAIPAAAANPEAAMAFIEFALSEDQQIAFSKGSGNLPALLSAQQHADIQSDPFMKKFVDFASHAPAVAPATPRYAQIGQIVGRAVQETMFGRMSAQDALDVAAREVAPLL